MPHLIGQLSLLWRPDVQGAWLAKSDIKSAFRLLPVSPSDYEL